MFLSVKFHVKTVQSKIQKQWQTVEKLPSSPACVSQENALVTVATHRKLNDKEEQLLWRITTYFCIILVFFPNSLFLSCTRTHTRTHSSQFICVHVFCVFAFLTKRGVCLCKQKEVQGISLLVSAIWKWVIIKGKVWAATQAVDWAVTVMQQEQEKVLSTHTHTNMICFSTCSSDPAHREIPTGFSNSPAKPIESRQEGVRSLKMLPRVLSSREINMRKMHIKHY